MQDFLLHNINTIFAYIFGTGGLLTAWFQRKKRKTDALTGMQQTYNRFVADYEKKFKDLHLEVTCLQEEIKRVEEHWKKKYEALKNQFEKYKKTHP